MGPRTDHPRVSFVIRLWLELRTREAPPEWRWWILHVQSGRERCGRRFEDLIQFVRDQSGMDPPRLESE